jgi:hypothetical protein
MHGHMDVTMHGHMNVTMHGHMNMKFSTCIRAKKDPNSLILFIFVRISHIT